MKQIDPYIFRAYDIRGIYKKNLDEDLMFKIGYVLGKKKKNFLVGNDIRKSGKSLAEALIAGLIKAGSEVVYTGTTSFGQTMFAGLHLKVYKTLYITASHLPPEWNGLKVYYGDGVAVPEREIRKTRDEVIRSKIKYQKSNIKIKRIDIKKKYKDYLLRKFPKIRNNKLKIVVDCGNGTMCLSALDIFRRFGFKVSELYCNPDPNFPGRGGEPKPNNLNALQDRVKKERADFGVAFDGDGDRAVIIDDKGRYLSGNQIGIIIAKNLLRRRKKGNIIASIACSMACERELSPFKAKIIRVPVGHTFLTILAKKYQAIFGVEESGHTVLTDCFYFDDALPVPLKIAEIILEEKKKLSELVDQLKIYPFEEINLDCPDDKKFEILKKIKKDFLKKYKKVITIDGVKVIFPEGWILIRVSNTSPIIRLYVEAENKKKFQELKNNFLKILKNEINK